MEQLTPQEEQLMLYIWENGKGFIKDFRNLYPNPNPPHTTLASIAKKLESKGYLVSRLYGNSYEYRPKVKKEEYKKQFMSDVVETFFQNSYKELVSFFAKDEKLSESDLEEIIRMIKDTK
jgi:Predicted transcriptional regulator